MKIGQFVWFNGQGWLYVGIGDEDGMLILARPLHNHPFQVLEFEQVYAEDFERFYKENGVMK